MHEAADRIRFGWIIRDVGAIENFRDLGAVPDPGCQDRLRLQPLLAKRTRDVAYGPRDVCCGREGGFDIPATLQAGVAFDVLKNLTFMADYKRIWFASIASVGNPSLLTAPFGVSNGPGFGVQDVDVVKLGLEWRRSPELTLRAGYSYNTAPIISRDADLNILSLGVVQNHFTGGLKYQLARNLDLEFSAMYAPRAAVRGTELGAPLRSVEIEASQVEVTVGVAYRFGERQAEPVAMPLK